MQKNTQILLVDNLALSFVISLPNIFIFLIILQTNNCNGGEAAGVVCDTSTEDEEVPVYDNCSLATPLYYTLRTSETYFKR